MTSTELAAQPIPNEIRPLVRKEVDELMHDIPQWTRGVNAIVREFRFKSFPEAMEFVSRVATLAHEQDHHPDIFISYNRVQLTLSTHKLKSLTMNDFILAAKIDRLMP